MDVAVVTDAIKRYASKKDKNLVKLMQTAEAFGVMKLIRSYMEVLLWEHRYKRRHLYETFQRNLNVEAEVLLRSFMMERFLEHIAQKAVRNTGRKK